MQCSCKCCDDNNCVVVLRDEGFWPMCGSTVQVTLEDFLFLLQLIKGKKKLPFQNLKTLEYILQFPGLYATSCKCYVIISSPWKTGLCYR